MEDASDLKLEELRAMRDEVSHLSRMLRDHFDGATVSACTRRLDVSIHIIEGERKPILVEIRGGISLSAKLSSVRASLLIALLVDLRDRHDGGVGVENLFEASTKVWAVLDPKSVGDGKAAARLRVALYRVEGFLKELSPSVSGLSLALDLTRTQLVVYSAGGAPAERLEIDIRPSTVELEQALRMIGENSPIALIRRRKAVFFPMDAAAIDRLHLAFLSSEASVRVRSLSFRLSHWLFPQALLERTAASAERRALAQRAAERLANGTLSFTEIVQRECLWDTIRESTKGKFVALPMGARVQEVGEYLDRLAALSSSDSGYQLVLTESELPFFIVTYQLAGECFTLLFRSPMEGSEAPCSCFAVYGEQFLERISEQVLEWTLSRSGTIEDRDLVAEEVRLVSATLSTSGPLLATSRMPGGVRQQTARPMPVGVGAARSSPLR